ncbi:hypothetical protein HOK68_00475 [Candidatus Woesearchaeota archaeon]|jgi:potassium channel LctB|nr:hypothetical protein [Candidatus Woesearchaeota archaeon]MBT4595737.1 hypothetical protein [Candidatus Woesearchaeota archaeon]MBT5741414.1 hypothetical protein [Candidatus Woesearchaeota archaeon]MBT6505236.1 hypothetical protein [Candidatus Woesearchaeota archaeon]MBT7848911.1 hypothetical protein [Candidatus Woesearchaeota archaeon]
MVNSMKNIMAYSLPIIFCFVMVGFISLDLFKFPPYYLTLFIYLLSVFVIMNFFKFIERGKVRNLGEFFGVMILFIFFVILMFSGIYHYYSTDNSTLINSNQNLESNGLVNAFYFSGVTFLAIGYGDIVPIGGFIIISILEGILGSVIIFSFVAIGAASIFDIERKRI